MIVVSDTPTICYLILIDEIACLPRLFKKVLIPPSVREELLAPGGSEKVRNWIEKPPKWLDFRPVDPPSEPPGGVPDRGETDVLALAIQSAADLVILDDQAGRQRAAELGLRFVGLVGILDHASQMHRVNFQAAIRRLEKTTLRIAPALAHRLRSRDVPRVADWMLTTAWRVSQRAEQGDPRALWELFRNLERFLRGKEELQQTHLRFMVDALKTLVGDSRLWERAAEEYQELDTSTFSYAERMLNRGPRISESAQRRIGRAFCKAFHISKNKGKLKNGEIPKSIAFTPQPVEKLRSLRLHGLSRRDSMRVTTSAFPEFSERRLDEWTRFLKIGKPKPGTGWDYQHLRNRLRMATQVLKYRTTKKCNAETAESCVAENVADNIFPDDRTSLEKWTDQVLERQTGQPPEYLEFARQVDSQWLKGEELPEIPAALYTQIEPELEKLGRRKTFLPPESMEPLIKAVGSARRYEREVRKAWPRWAKIWAYLEHRYSRPH